MFKYSIDELDRYSGHDEDQGSLSFYGNQLTSTRSIPIIPKYMRNASLCVADPGLIYTIIEWAPHSLSPWTRSQKYP